MGRQYVCHLWGISVNVLLCHPWGMARTDEYFRLRISENLKRRVYEAAIINQRSMTAEIVARLEASFLLVDTEGEGPIDPEVAEILSDFERLKARVIRLAR